MRIKLIIFSDKVLRTCHYIVGCLGRTLLCFSSALHFYSILHTLVTNGGGGVSHTKQFCHNSRVSYNLVLTHLSGVSVRSHKLRTESQKTVLPSCPLQTPVARLSPVLLTNWLQIKSSYDPLFEFDRFARVAHKTQENRLLSRLLVYYKKI